MASRQQLKRTSADVIDAVRSNKVLTVFLGAGISRTAGIPLAGEIVFDLAKRLRDRDAPEQSDGDDPWEWLKAQPFYDARNPYASVLDAAFSNRTERTQFFEKIIHGAVPTKAHLAIAGLMERQVVSLALTTNFDRLMEHAIVRICGRMPCVLLYDELPSIFAIRSQRPKVLKLHGDYLFGNIRNLDRELHVVKQSMSEKIDIAAKQGPCVVAGYSGADSSVMEVVERLAADDDAFPGGVFWLQLDGTTLNDRVLNFLQAASHKGSGVIGIDNADEFFTELADTFTSSAATEVVPSKPSTQLMTVAPDDVPRFVRECLDQDQANEFLHLLGRRAWLQHFVRTLTALDYLLARYEESGDIPGNAGELLDRYVDFLIGGSVIESAEFGGEATMESRAAQRKPYLQTLEPAIDGDGQRGQSIFHHYFEALRLVESGVEHDKIGPMLTDKDAYEALRLYVGLLQDATHVVKAAITQSVDQIVLHGRMEPWPTSFYKAAALVGASAYVEKSTVEWIVDMLLLEFDVERWFPRAAISALAAMGNRVIEHLLPYMLDPLQDTFSREDAALALGGIGNRQVVESLAEAGGNASSRNAKMVVYALGHTGNPRAVEAVRNLAPKICTMSQFVLENALKALGYEGSDILAGAQSEEPDPRPEVNRDAVLEEHGIGPVRSPEDKMLQDLFRRNARECMQLIRRHGVPQDARVLSSVGVRLLAQNKPWAAEVICAECLERYPMFPQSFHNMALCFSRQGRPLAARRYYALGSSLEPDFGEYYNDFGIAMQKLGNLEAARYLFIRAICMAPKNHRPWLNLAQVNLVESGFLNGPSINDTPDGDPLHSGLYTTSSSINVGAVVDVGRIKDATICLRQVVRLKPEHPTAGGSLANLRRIYPAVPETPPMPEELNLALHLGETTPGSAVYIESLPSDVREAWQRAGDLLYEGNLMGAITAMEIVLAKYADSPNIYHNLSFLYSTAGLSDNAVCYAEKGLAKWPLDYDLLLNYSSLLVQVGRLRESVQIAEKAVCVKPLSATSWYCLARALHADGRDDDAADACREAIRVATRWSNVEIQARQLSEVLERAVQINPHS